MFRWLATDFDVLPELFVTRPPEGGRPVVDSVRPRVVVAKSARAKKGQPMPRPPLQPSPIHTC